MASQTSDPVTDESDEVTTDMTQPIIVDLGKQRPKKLKDLKNGEGELWEEVLDVLEEVKDMLGEDADGKLLVPIVMLYERKQRRARIEKLLFPLAN